MEEVPAPTSCRACCGVERKKTMQSYTDTAHLNPQIPALQSLALLKDQTRLVTEANSCIVRVIVGALGRGWRRRELIPWAGRVNYRAV